MTRYRERLRPGVGTALAVLLLAPAIALVVLPLGLPPWAPAVLGIAAAAVVEALLVGASPVVEVGDGALRAGPASIPVAMTGRTEAFRARAATVARGTGLDARAWTLLRGWVDPVLRIEVVDPDDPAPYWVLSTRRPEALAEALSAERAEQRAA